jgi:hypothetical protein
MSGRQYLYSFALAAVAVVFLSFRPFNQQPAKTNEGPKWAYHVVQLQAGKCTAEGLSTSLNDSGQQGWELVGYAQEPAENALTMQMTSTYGQAEANSYTGTLKPAEIGCKLVFKRLVR